MHERRKTLTVHVGNVNIGSQYPICLQSMASVDTLNTQACVKQTLSMVAHGCHVVRFTASTPAQSAALTPIKEMLAEQGCAIPMVADVHFNPSAAFDAAARVDKVRINPGNFSGGTDDNLTKLIEICRTHNTAIRIGVNHGSLSERIMQRYGDTPEGMVESAMEYLRCCDKQNFHNVVVSMKSSNVGVMVAAYRMLVDAMDHEKLNYPLHLGVTEAGDGQDGRVKSAVGIGTLLAEGIGDTIRVSLTESPDNELHAARILVDYIESKQWTNMSLIKDYDRRNCDSIGNIGGENPVLVVTGKDAIDPKIQIVENFDQLIELTKNTSTPIILKKTYHEDDLETLQIKAACDFGAALLAGVGNGIWIDNQGAIGAEQVSSLAYTILQATRVRITKTEYIACPGCGRTLFDLPDVLHKVRESTKHLTGLKIAVMGCIVNGPGEMADADYGYVGAGRNRVSLYRGKTLIESNIPQDQAIEKLLDLISKSSS